MSWTRGTLPALAVCVLLLTGSAGCGSSGEPARDPAGSAAAPSPVGKVLDDTDDDGRHYREVAREGAPHVRVEVEPDADGSWDVRLNVRDFRFSPAGTAKRAVPGRGTARLFVDDRSVADLRDPAYRIPAGYLPHGTHQVTARLYADDGTVWAVDGRPVQSTADITASEPDPSGDTAPESSGVAPSGASGAGAGSGAGSTGVTTAFAPTSAGYAPTLSAPGVPLRTGGRGSPDRGGKAS
ncbi:nuclear transport factor 2 family protein [Streptomyces sp. NPDC091281]|uniref:nuclear transport factor 2 family protein n=1 Tax=Streptomyces sp. NPDC091281 TaxID=3365985 RepID=UPI00381EACF0